MEMFLFLFINVIIAFRKCAFWFKQFLRWAMWPMGFFFKYLYIYIGGGDDVILRWNFRKNNAAGEGRGRWGRGHERGFKRRVSNNIMIVSSSAASRKIKTPRTWYINMTSNDQATTRTLELNRTPFVYLEVRKINGCSGVHWIVKIVTWLNGDTGSRTVPVLWREL